MAGWNAGEMFKGADGASDGSITVVKSDTTVFSRPTRALYVGSTGDVAVRMVDGSLPIFANVPTGAILPISVDKVLSTGTTAAFIIGLL